MGEVMLVDLVAGESLSQMRLLVRFWHSRGSKAIVYLNNDSIAVGGIPEPEPE